VRRFETTVDLDAAPAAVWAVMSDVERWAEWTPSIRSITRTSSGPMGVGSTALVKQPKLAPAHFVVTKWEPGRGFDWTTKHPLVTAIGSHWIEPVGAGSRVTLSVEYGGALARLIAWAYAGLTNRYLRMEAEGLKRRLESSAAAAH
jgi:carbon monoxide dehydrogenase subunit G